MDLVNWNKAMIYFVVIIIIIIFWIDYFISNLAKSIIHSKRFAKYFM